MQSVFKKVLAAALVIAGVAGAVLAPEVALAGTCPNGGTYTNTPAECGMNAISGGNPTNSRGLFDVVQTGINVVLSVVGVVAVIMIIIGGINFIISQGDAAKVTKARNTILYGVVGLIVAILAFAIVNFVLTGVFASSAVTTP